MKYFVVHQRTIGVYVGKIIQTPNSDKTERRTP